MAVSTSVVTATTSTGPDPPSVEYPARVYFWTGDPAGLIAGGYDSIRIEKRKTCHAEWKPAKADDCELQLRDNQFNYLFLDPCSLRGNEYRAVLQNSDTPGTPPDVNQPVTRAVDPAFEMVMSVQELKEIYLWGQDAGFVTDDGQTQPDYTFVHNILNGIGKVERKLDIRLMPQRFVEKHDWVPESMGKGFLSLVLDEFPLLRVDSMTLRLPGATPFEYPASWIQVDNQTGSLEVVPDSPGPVTPFTARYIPRCLEIVYWAGFEPPVPAELKEVVGKESAFGPLNVGGDLIGGAGLAGTSLSMDGLSQSVTTTNSSTNAGFGARLIQYEKELREAYKSLLRYYKGARIQVS